MSKRSSSSIFLTFILLIAVVFFLHRAQDRIPAAHLPELTRGAEAGTSVAEEYFSPAEDIERIDHTRLEQAKSTVDIAMYAFTDRYLAED